ncbi:MAG: sigma-54 dependent transcriptional regulator [Thermodesulfobacteriota bacterium]|nr:sigma-54 dependent transcriptional regulator [Thermodesulfobacteriota bacterium]
MIEANILIVEDDALIRWSLSRDLKNEGYDISLASSGEEALEKFEEELPDLILLDIVLPGINGIEVLKKIRELDAEAPVVMMTALEEVQTAVTAMKLGAYDYVSKPFKLEEVRKTVFKALETVLLKKEVTYLRKKQMETVGLDNIIGNSQSMQEVFTRVKQIAQSDATTILLRGESGTGKDLISQTIHYQSSRFEKSYIEINCAAIPETLLEAELTGYEKGAFTDAKGRKKGVLELGNGGTILLDEISEMSTQMQAKLLRILENKRFRRLGGLEDIIIDVRIIAATNKDLWTAVQDGTFRQDLYYRLKVFPIYLPSLRERKEDIPSLAKHFIDIFNKESRNKVNGMSPEAEALLIEYEWPGNVRELKNVIERAVILGEGSKIMPHHLPREIVTNSSLDLEKKNGITLPPDGVCLEFVEKELIRQALERSNGNQTHAAKLLGLSRDALRYRMKKFGYLEEKEKE